MKKRVRVDSALLSFLIILTGISFWFRDLYPQSQLVDNIFDFFGVILILKGTFARMVARGYKKAHSGQGHELVIDGPYLLTRNPMYLGSFMLGAGYILILWPWWFLPVFAFLFYLRFNKQMMIEERHLTEQFGDAYKKYCKKVARIFPKISAYQKVKVRDVVNLDQAMSTKEIRGLITWPLVAFGLELVQQLVVRGEVTFQPTAFLFMSAVIVYNVAFILVYQMKS